MPLDIEDHAQLARWLADHGHAPSPEAVRCRTLAGGVSNKTVWVEVAGMEDGSATRSTGVRRRCAAASPVYGLEARGPAGPSTDHEAARRDREAAPRTRAGRPCHGGSESTAADGPVLPSEIGPRRLVLKQALARLRVKDEWLSDVARVRCEAEALRVLPDLAPTGTITPLVFEAPEENLLAMEAVPEPHDNLKTLLMEGTLSRGEVLDYAGQLGRLLSSIQWKSRSRTPAQTPSDLQARFGDRSFFESLRVGPYYQTSAEREPASRVFYQALIEDTRRVAERSGCLVHGDFSPKNVLVRAGRLVLLDHEVIHWGDGAFDVGFCLTHWLSKAHHVRSRRADYLDGARAFALEAECRNPLDEGQCVRHTLGCLLARVVGKSPLEYLTTDERERQKAVVLGLMRSPPPTLESLVRALIEGIES